MYPIKTLAKHVVIDSREPEIKKLARGEQCEGVAIVSSAAEDTLAGVWWAVKDSNRFTLPL